MVAPACSDVASLTVGLVTLVDSVVLGEYSPGLYYRPADADEGL
jgi:hypothetical protein